MDMLRLQSSANSSSSEMMDKAQRVWNMLDELASSDPTAYKNYIGKTLQEGKEWMAPPAPCLAIRSRLHSHENIKSFYLNVFTWSRLPSPVKTDEVTKMYSLTPTETSHNDESCIIVNIAVHPNVMKIISRTQLIRSAFDLVVSQHHLLIDCDHYQILDEKVIGDAEEIQRNFVKPMLKNKKPEDRTDEVLNHDLSPALIKQLSSMTTSDSSSSKQQPQKKNTKAPVLIEELWTVPTFTEEISNNSNFLIIRVSLPECSSVADCDVTVLPREEVVQVQCSKLHMRLDLDMKKRKKPNVPNSNSAFDTQRLTAKFVRKTQQLVLTIPILVESITTEQNN